MRAGSRLCRSWWTHLLAHVVFACRPMWMLFTPSLTARRSSATVNRQSGWRGGVSRTG